MSNLSSAYNLSVGNSLIIAGDIQQNAESQNNLGSITTNQINADSIISDSMTSNELMITGECSVNNLTVNGITTLLENVDLSLYDTTFYDINLSNSIKFTLLGVEYTLGLAELKKLLNSASTTYVDTSITTAINNLLGPDLDVSYDTLKEIQLILQDNEQNITTLLSAVSAKTTLTEIQNHENVFTNENTFNSTVYINSNLVVNGTNIKNQTDANSSNLASLTTQTNALTTNISTANNSITTLQSDNEINKNKLTQINYSDDTTTIKKYLYIEPETIEDTNFIFQYNFESEDVSGSTIRNIVNNDYSRGILNQTSINSTYYKFGNSSLYSNNSYFQHNLASSHPGNIGNSITFWIYGLSSQTAATPTILNFRHANTASSSFYFYINSFGDGLFYWKLTTTIYEYNTGIKFNDNVWKHITILLTPSAQYPISDVSKPGIRLYVNGVLSFTSPNDFYTNSTIVRLELGAKSDLTNSNFNGYFDGFRYYKRVLTNTEITNIYKFSDYQILGGSGYFDKIDCQYINGINKQELLFMKSINTELDDMKNDILTNTNDIEENDLKFADLETNISQNATNINIISGLYNDLDEKTKGMTYNTLNDTTLIDNNVNITGQITNTELNTATEDIVLIKADINVIDGELDTIFARITDINYDVITDTTSIANNLNVSKNLSISGNVDFLNNINNISSTVFNYMSGVSSNIQTQFNTLHNKTFDIEYDSNTTTITGDLFITGNINNITSPVFNYLSGLTSNIQTQFNALFNRTTNITYNSDTTTISGDLATSNINTTNLSFTGNINGIISPTELAHLNGISVNIADRLNTTPGIRFERVRIGGSASAASGYISLPLGYPSDYSVFTTIYHGFSGSAGTYNPTETSGAIDPVVITNISSSGFNFVMTKTTGQNVNIDIHFFIISNISGLNYAKNW
jgi:hypothetical protein